MLGSFNYNYLIWCQLVEKESSIDCLSILNLSACAYHHILKLVRMVADLMGR